MEYEFKLPDIGEGIAEGEIVRWRVEEGQAVKENDPFVDVMTDKATVEIPAPVTGTVKALKAAAGTTVPVGSVIAVFEKSGSGAAKEAAPKEPAPKDAAAKPAAREPAPRDAAAATGSPAKEPARASAPAAPARSSPAPAREPATREPAPARPAVAADATRAARDASGAGGNGATLVGGRVLAAPAVRRRAREMGIDLHEVAGSGPAGRVSQGDLERFVESRGRDAPSERAVAEAPARPTRPVPAPQPAAGTEERIPLRGIRKRIAERMAKSKRTAAHFTYVDEVDVTALVETRESLKEAAAKQGVKLTYMPFIVQATVAALKEFPQLNAMLDDEKQEIVVKHYWHIGFAADTEQGLVVPVVKDADRRSLVNLAAAIQDLAARAREGKLTIDEVTGSTFTITNAGSIGGILATPVINHPEVAILGVHKIADRAVVRDGAIVIRKMMNLSISIDHRVVDGADGARFMNRIVELLEDPRRLLLGTL